MCWLWLKSLCLEPLCPAARAISWLNIQHKHSNPNNSELRHAALVQNNDRTQYITRPTRHDWNVCVFCCTWQTAKHEITHSCTTQPWYKIATKLYKSHMRPNDMTTRPVQQRRHLGSKEEPKGNNTRHRSNHPHTCSATLVQANTWDQLLTPHRTGTSTSLHRATSIQHRNFPWLSSSQTATFI